MAWSETKEFHDIRREFEKWLETDYAPYTGALPRRAAGKIKNIFYESGQHNDLFKAYISGYQLSKLNQKLEDYGQRHRGVLLPPQ